MSVDGIGAVTARMAELRGLVEGLSATTSASAVLASGASGQAGSGTSSTGTRFAGALGALTGLSGTATGSAPTSGATVTGFGASSGVSGSGLGADGVARGLSGAQGVTGEALVAAAKRYVGTPYVWGGETLAEGGLDCSGLVVRSLGDLGVSGMPRVARDQMHMGTEVPSLDQAHPGDLLIFGGGSHVGIYVGDGAMIDAPKPGGHVSVRDVYETPTTIRRILPQAPADVLPVGLPGGTTSLDLAALLSGSGTGALGGAGGLDLAALLSGGSTVPSSAASGAGTVTDPSRSTLDLLLSLSEVTS